MLDGPLLASSLISPAQKLPQDTMSVPEAPNADLLEKARRLAEGFRALTQDYSELAARHWNVETQLDSIVNQVRKQINLLETFSFTHEKGSAMSSLQTIQYLHHNGSANDGCIRMTTY